MKKNKTLTRYTFLLIPACLAINILGAQLALLFDLPLFLDSIGTVLAAVLGGYLPGIIVGFFSNAINGISDPITLYYGTVSILIAICAAWLTTRRAYARPLSAILTAIPYALLGGGLGSVFTWLLYGMSFGTGISAPFAIYFYDVLHIPQFWAQFTADMAIDTADKLVTVIIIYAVVRLLPKKLLSCFANSRYLSRETEACSSPSSVMSTRGSLKNKVLALIIVSALTLGSSAITISFLVYKDAMTVQYTEECESVVSLMEQVIDPADIEGYLLTEKEDQKYARTEAELKKIKDSFPVVEYMYVYQVREDGCHVVYDLDTPELPGEPLGSLVPHDESFSPYLDALLAGEKIDPVISNETYGWLLTVYRPLYAPGGDCVAYAAADVSMAEVITDQYIFIIRMISLLFGLTIVLIICTVWFADRSLVQPINAMTEAAGKFAYDSENGRIKSIERLNSLSITTGDEIERLFDALEKTATDVAKYITVINENAKTIAHLHSGIILSFANMVENRDSNTGEHIKHTAAYVRALAEELKRRGYHPELMTDEFIESIEKNAPLHDIGKICVSDVILNKPGKLTSEEFELMKSHTCAGREILMSAAENTEDSSYLRDAMDMATCHHERWDGSGYPYGLAGEKIPLSARIMAVADVFDALISRRSYKDALPVDEAFRIIASGAGTHFDPDVVDAFLAIQPDIMSMLWK